MLPFVRYKYIYKGNEVERTCRKNLKAIRNHAAEINTLQGDSIMVKNSGYGELAWTLALVHRDMQVYAVESDEDKFLFASHTSYIPENLHFARNEAEIPSYNQIVDTQDFMK